MIDVPKRATIRPRPTVCEGKSVAGTRIRRRPGRARCQPRARGSVLLCSRPRLYAAVSAIRRPYGGVMTSNPSPKSTHPKTRAEVGSPLPEEPTSEMLVLPREECLRLLSSHRFGRLAVAMDSPVIRPVNYVFDERSQSVA